MAESDTKAWVRYRYPRWWLDGAALCGGQTHIEQAPVFVAVCADLHKIAAACAQNGVELQSQSLELFLQATVDAALLGQNLALAAESEGLGICMIGAARNHPIELAKLLELPRHVFAVFGMVVGHPTDDPVPRGRMPLGAVRARVCMGGGAESRDLLCEQCWENVLY